MRAIVAIGGGTMRSRSRLAIDREIIRLSGKKNPKLLFIPTASSDSMDTWKLAQQYYGDFLRCKTDVLFLIGLRPSMADIEDKILKSDIVFVAGGNTLKMMRLWRRLGVDQVLRTAYAKGIVLSGVSAGAICWFQSGHSDSMSFYNPHDWRYTNVKGLGLISGPHYNGRTLGAARRRDFQNMILRTKGFGIAMEDNCAIAFIDDKYYKVISSKPGAGAYKVYSLRGALVSERLQLKPGLSPIAELYAPGT